MAYKRTAKIYPEQNGIFAFDNGRTTQICTDADIVGAYLEQMLWPLIEPLLKQDKPIRIEIHEDKEL